MSQRTDYLVDVLKHIGSPLMVAINRALVGNQGVEADAKSLAEALGKSVKTGIDLGDLLDLNPVEANDDSLRVGLTALASSLVAAQIEKKGQMPEDGELKRIVDGMQTVVAFSDNFSPSPENIARLEHLKAMGPAGDVAQTNLQYVFAFLPVVQAISEFSFGEQEQKLTVDVTGKIVLRSDEMAMKLMPLLEEEAFKSASLALLGSLAQIYVDAHRAEVKAAAANTEGPGPSLDKVWSRFDAQVSMLEILVQNLVPDDLEQSPAAGPAVQQATDTAPSAPMGGQASVQPAPQQDTEASAAPVTPPAQQAQELAQAAAPSAPQQAPVAQEPAQAQAQAQVSANPMSMFASKPQETQNAPAQEAQQAPPSPPVTPPPAVQNETVAQTSAPAQNQAEQANQANPMAMFASKPQEAQSAPAQEAPQMPPAQPAQSVAPPVQHQAPAAQEPAQAQASTNPMAMFASKPQETQAPQQQTADAQASSGEGAAEGSSEGSSSAGESGGGPMSFFKKGD